MIVNEIPLSREPEFDFDILAPKERIIFFDIETTGLSPANASVYLIGAVMLVDGRWILRQFFAESFADEPVLLESFFKLIRERRKNGRAVLISYNGDGFDIPFIKKCAAQYCIANELTDVLSVDLFRKIKPYKALAGLTDCRLKTVEKLFGIFREDKYNGGELIYVYEEYLRLSGLDENSCEYNRNNLLLKDELLRTLLLHNAEDIMDMPFIMNVMGYDILFSGGFSVENSIIENGVWDIRARLDIPLPKGIYFEDQNYTISISEEEPLLMNIAVTLFEGELKYFYADHKNYYYLPAEDCAVHKSVGEFVDKKARRQATAKNCYRRVSGLFVPENEAVFAPAFYSDYKKLPMYGQVGEKGLKPDGGCDRDTIRRYVMSVLKELNAGSSRCTAKRAVY